MNDKVKDNSSLIMTSSSSFRKLVCQKLGNAFLFTVTALPTLAIIFILFFISKEAFYFFKEWELTKEFFTSPTWAPSKEQSPHFGALSIFYGTFLVSVLSCLIAVPIGICVALALSEIIHPKISEFLKPIVELLAAIPSVAYGFFALIILAPLLQNYGGALMGIGVILTGLPLAFIMALLFSNFIFLRFKKKKAFFNSGAFLFILTLVFFTFPLACAYKVFGIEIQSGTNALNASLILAIMALPTIVSISQDALSSVGKDMREGSLALGATRSETIFKVILPCAKSGIMVAVILGLMRVIGETMVVWMASGNSLKIPEPFFNVFEPVRTLTATIAGEMGEADQTTGSARYHVLFAMSFCLLVSGLVLNGVSQFVGGGKKFRKKS